MLIFVTVALFSGGVFGSLSRLRIILPQDIENSRNSRAVMPPLSIIAPEYLGVSSEDTTDQLPYSSLRPSGQRKISDYFAKRDVFKSNRHFKLQKPSSTKQAKKPITRAKGAASVDLTDDFNSEDRLSAFMASMELED